MKIVKTQRNWKLYQQGYPIALRFDSWTDASRAGIEKLCRERLGNEYIWAGLGGQWKSHWASASRAGQSRPYFIGLRDEATVTMILLSLNSST